MSEPLFILKSKTFYQGSPEQIRIEFEPLVDSPLSDNFWADPKNPNGRSEFYITSALSQNYPVGGKFRLALIFIPS
ncbi:hypothetical protein [uncultured Nostoc sp.]|uniref:hypothetical protein n=1 Tax=uncultured Nostoc sp. TaxID=340711 RepID=UPI0035CB0D2E